MCRFAACAARRDLPLSALLYDPPHALERQSYEPREMVSGTVNVDGTGVAWWPEGEREPLLYVTERPPWSDPNLPRLAPRLRGSVQLACVRSATPGRSFGPECVQPFVEAGVAGALNGYVGMYRERLARAMALELPEGLFGRLVSGSDASALFLLAIARLDGRDPRALARAAAAAVGKVAEMCDAAGAEGSLNLLLCSSEGIAAVRHATGMRSNSLYTRAEGTGAQLVASEPLDEEAWSEVPEGHVVFGDATGVAVEPLEGAFR